MPLVFTVANDGGATVTLHVQGRAPTADFRIADLEGRPVWSFLGGRTLLGALRLYPLGAGRRLRFRRVWNQRTDAGRPAPPGDYVVRGVLLTDEAGGMSSPPTRLRVTR